jgi:hypothetical protein
MAPVVMQMMIRSKEAGWSGPVNPWYVDVGIPDAVHFQSLIGRRHRATRGFLRKIS